VLALTRLGPAAILTQRRTGLVIPVPLTLAAHVVASS
jgi:hypothetical protein